MLTALSRGRATRHDRSPRHIRLQTGLWLSVVDDPLAIHIVAAEP
jgi:hypothetical protein